MTKKVGIIGAGNWGTALAKHLAEKGDDVTIWCHEKEVAEAINNKHENPLYLTKTALPKGLKATCDFKETISNKEAVISVVPSQFVRSIWNKAGEFLSPKTILVSATKGIEIKTLKLMGEVLKECLPSHPASHFTFLSGPSFAREVSLGLPTSVVVAGEDQAVAQKIQQLFRTINFLTFTNDDVAGVEVGGAVKNVIAIAAGVSDGLKFGNNARAALITRGLYEMVKLGKFFGAHPVTFLGLSGIGDLILTCAADLSRNHTVGKKLAEGLSLDEIMSETKMVAEGVRTAEAVHRLASKHKIQMPICEATYRMLYKDLTPHDAVVWLCSMTLDEELSAVMT